MNKPAFHEEYISPHRDPLAPTHEDFDFDAVSRNLGEPVEAAESIVITDDLLQAFTGIIRFCLNIDINKKTPTDVLVGRRLIALAWVMNPGLFEGSPSITSLCERLGLSAFAMKRLTGQVSREFEITNRAQAHAWNRGAAADNPASIGSRVYDTSEVRGSSNDAPQVKAA